MAKMKSNAVLRADQIPNTGPQQNLDVRQVAALMGVGQQTVLDLCDPAAPKLRHYRPTPRKIIVLRKDFEAYMAGSVVEPSKPATKR